MPDKDVQTIRDLLHYQYAKVIARRAFDQPHGVAAKRQHHGFIKQKFRQLKNGEIKWSDITREDWQLVETERACAYCGSPDDLAREHIVPRSLCINERCPTCDTIQSIHNQVWACRSCNSLKGPTGLYSFYAWLRPNDRKFYDRIPPLVEKKYLKTVCECLDCAGLLEAGDQDGDGDGELTVLDIDFGLERFVPGA
jgi:5-methylcytosine-specific restriction endonuclease McrA